MFTVPRQRLQFVKLINDIVGPNIKGKVYDTTGPPNRRIDNHGTN
jgi:hypothetical protein